MNIATLGFDPGGEGAISVLDAVGRPVFSQAFAYKMTEDQVLEVAWAAANALLKAGGFEGYAEKVGHISGDGAQGSHSFGRSNGTVRAALKSRGVKLYDVPPQLWQAKLECMTGGDKNVSKRRAIELFPGVKITLKNADSLLIALYGRTLR